MYNQPFSQPPGMFGAQSAMAQMQSAPSLPAGKPGAREYFNYSMAALSDAVENAAMPQAMMPQGISSLVPQYQFGGGVSLADAISMASNAPDIESVEAAFDAAGISVPGFNAPSVDPAVIAAAQSIDRSLSDDEDAQMQQRASDLNALMSQMQDEAARGTLSRDEGNQLSANQAVMEMTQPSGGSTPVGMQPSYSDQPQQSLSGSPPPNLLQSALNLLDEYAMPSERGPGILAAGLGPFSIVPTIVTRGAEALGLEAGPFYGDQGGFETDLAALSIPTGIKFLRTPPPEIGDDGEPDLGDPEQAAETITQPAYVQPVYQTYAGLGLPSVSPIPPLRRVTVPISSFVV